MGKTNERNVKYLYLSSIIHSHPREENFDADSAKTKMIFVVTQVMVLGRICAGAVHHAHPAPNTSLLLQLPPKVTPELPHLFHHYQLCLLHLYFPVGHMEGGLILH